MASSERPIIGITMGDPCGIGPEVILRALARKSLRRSARFVLLGSSAILNEVARKFDLDASFLRPVKVFAVGGGERVTLVNLASLPRSLALRGEATAEGGRASIALVEQGIALAMNAQIDALVTAPINKRAVSMANLPWPGHTELLQARTGSRQAVMLMAGGGLRVALVTTHHALRDVSGLITKDRVLGVIRILNDALRDSFGIPKPRIAVCGLNPHAGEAGRFGDEEQRAIVPAVNAAEAEGIRCFGPIPADVVFRGAYGKSAKYDAVVAMYHDQGCIPVKLLAFESGVNVTLGLPIIRTSPDHGTAYDIVREGRADPRSMIAAVELAVRMARARNKNGDRHPRNGGMSQSRFFGDGRRAKDSK
jgi:4-hydroxythreonine-4-phosphate dehydrogenase